MKKVLALVLALVMVLSMTACGSKGGEANADKVYELKVSTTQTEKSMIYAGLQAAADAVAEKTNGKVKVTIYPSSQLGAEEEDVLFNQYRSKRTTSPDGSYSHVTEFGFQVGMRSFVVVCHEEDGQWWVCEECTEFD